MTIKKYIYSTLLLLTACATSLTSVWATSSLKKRNKKKEFKVFYIDIVFRTTSERTSKYGTPFGIKFVVDINKVSEKDNVYEIMKSLLQSWTNIEEDMINSHDLRDFYLEGYLQNPVPENNDERYFSGYSSTPSNNDIVSKATKLTENIDSKNYLFDEGKKVGFSTSGSISKNKRSKKAIYLLDTKRTTSQHEDYNRKMEKRRKKYLKQNQRNKISKEGIYQPDTKRTTSQHEDYNRKMEVRETNTMDKKSLQTTSSSNKWGYKEWGGIILITLVGCYGLYYLFQRNKKKEKKHKGKKPRKTRGKISDPV